MKRMENFVWPSNKLINTCVKTWLLVHRATIPENKIRVFEMEGGLDWRGGLQGEGGGERREREREREMIAR